MRDLQPFTIHVADEVLDDLQDRLARTRWPEAETVDDWSQGVPLAYLQEVAAHWAGAYDWRAREAALNAVDQFTVPIDGLDIHFIHQRSPHPGATPLLLTHGWPGSVVEFHAMIGPLVDPPAHGGDAADAFHVVAPSLPGFGFSGKPAEAGWGVGRIAGAFAELMAGLSYDRYLAHGGDWGSAVSTALAALDPDHCAAIHLTFAPGMRPQVGDDPSPEEQRALARIQRHMKQGIGYSTQQTQRPQTIGYALVDSPVGQLAWILEKFREWTDCDGHPENAIDRDVLLDDAMLYWVTASGASSARLYWESFTARSPKGIGVPTGFCVFPEEIVPPVRAWLTELYPNITHWTVAERGGHFAALEVPDVLVADLRAWARGHR